MKKKHLSYQPGNIFLDAGKWLGLLDRMKRQFQGRGHHIFFASMPKSGSTYISRKIAEYYDYPFVHFSDRDGGVEFDLYRPALITQWGRNAVVQQHTLGTEGNIHYLRKLEVRPVVLVRDIFDALVSFRDHLLKENAPWPFLSAAPDFNDWEEETQYDFVIDQALPWFLHFYVSWYRATRMEPQLPALWIKYQRLLDGEKKLFRDIIQWTGGKVDSQRLEQVLGRKEGHYRINRGKAGRGKKKLSEAQQARIRRMARYYPEVDFGAIGIPMGD